MQQTAIERFRALAEEPRFKGWPLVGDITEGPKIPYFGSTINYKLKTGNGEEEDYTSIIRSFGWVVVFGVTEVGNVITLCQWKPGVNCASWELPPGGIGKLDPGVTMEEITQKTKDSYLKETGYGEGNWSYLGHTMIETGKFRGAGPDDHGLKAHMFLATDLEQFQESRNPNPNEIMETVMVDLDEFQKVLASGLFTETSAVACAYKALQQLGMFKWV